MKKLIRIEARHFVAGVETSFDTVCRTAPILKYMLGWERSRVEAYAKKKGWKVETVATKED